jgi:carbon storage regulator
MLVLTRIKGEKIMIDNAKVVIEVVEIRGNRVRLGITCPSDMPIHRQEVYEAMQADKAEVKE